MLAVSAVLSSNLVAALLSLAVTQLEDAGTLTVPPLPETSIAPALAEDAGVPEPVAQAERPSLPAQGSVPGFWALPQVGVGFASVESVIESDLFNQQSQFVTGSASLSVVAGYGLNAGPVRLSPSLHFAIAERLIRSTFTDPTGFSWSPVELALAAPDLVNERHTGLRLTPIFGGTVPTGAAAFSGASPLTTLSAALQLERRFSFVELAYRVTGGAGLGCRSLGCPQWRLSHQLLAEAWVRKSVSVALGGSWLTSWLQAFFVGQVTNLREVSPIERQRVQAVALVSWAFTSRFGLTLGGRVEHEFGFPEPTRADPFAPRAATIASWEAGGSLSLWFRTDELLQRNWLDR